MIKLFYKLNVLGHLNVLGPLYGGEPARLHELIGFAELADSPKQLIFKIIDQMSYLQEHILIQRLSRASPPKRDLFGLHKLS